MRLELLWSPIERDYEFIVDGQVQGVVTPGSMESEYDHLGKPLSADMLLRLYLLMCQVDKGEGRSLYAINVED